MSKPEDYQEEEAKPFNVADHRDELNVIEAHIGDLEAKVERLQALLADIAAIVARG
jgi:hypothetical protein